MNNETTEVSNVSFCENLVAISILKVGLLFGGRDFELLLEPICKINNDITEVSKVSFCKKLVAISIQKVVSYLQELTELLSSRNDNETDRHLTN